MNNEMLLEVLLKYIKEQAAQGNAGYYTSIIKDTKKLSVFKNLAKGIVDTDEKQALHKDPNEYTLEDIIDFVITYEMAKNSGNSEVFVRAAEDELELIKKGNVFQSYQEMLFPDQNLQPVRPKLDMQPKSKKQSEKKANPAPATSLDPETLKCELAFLEQMLQWIKSEPEGTEIGWQWKSLLADKDGTDELMQETMKNGRFDTTSEDRRQTVSDLDVIELVVLYSAAKKSGRENEFISLIQPDIKRVRLSHAAEDMYGLLEEKYGLTTSLPPEELELRPSPIVPNMDDETILSNMLKYIKEQAKQGNAEYYTSTLKDSKKLSDFENLAKEIVNTDEKQALHNDPDEYTLNDIIDFVITYEIARKSGNSEVFVRAAEDEFACIKRGKVFQHYMNTLFPDKQVASGKISPKALDPQGFPTTLPRINSAGRGIAKSGRAQPGYLPEDRNKRNEQQWDDFDF